MIPRHTRRALLSVLPGAVAAAQIQNPRPQTRRPRDLPRVGEFVRLQDPVTETTLVRLTALSSANRLPAPANRFVSAKNRFLVFSSDRTGSFSPHLLDLRNGIVHLLTETANLDTSSLCLDETEHALLFIDGANLREVQLSTKRVRTIAEGAGAFTVGSSIPDLLLVRDGNLQRLSGETLATGADSVCQIRPGGLGCLFERGGGGETQFWYAPFSDPAKAFLLANGRIRFPFWSPDGQAILFLRDVERPGARVSQIWRSAIDQHSEECVSATSQFAAFAPNGDATVFVGASRSKAQPTVVLLLRSSKRELTLCEHHATEPGSVTPVFAPDSRRVYFQSDREGKTALYSVNVELLVEPTLTS